VIYQWYITIWLLEFVAVLVIGSMIHEIFCPHLTDCIKCCFLPWTMSRLCYVFFPHYSTREMACSWCSSVNLLLLKLPSQWSISFRMSVHPPIGNYGLWLIEKIIQALYWATVSQWIWAVFELFFLSLAVDSECFFLESCQLACVFFISGKVLLNGGLAI
jgi:hypothetical protein